MNCKMKQTNNLHTNKNNTKQIFLNKVINNNTI